MDTLRVFRYRTDKGMAYEAVTPETAEWAQEDRRYTEQSRDSLSKDESEFLSVVGNIILVKDETFDLELYVTNQLGRQVRVYPSSSSTGIA